MNKYQEALNALDKLYEGYKNGMVGRHYYDIVRELIDKEKPMKPITHTQEGVYAIPLCPKCKKPLNEHKDKPNYCSNCGQRLRSDEE